MGASPPGARPDLRQAKAPNTNPSCTSPSSFCTAVQNGKDGLVQVGQSRGPWNGDGQGRSLVAVSDTHLTLPTFYAV